MPPGCGASPRSSRYVAGPGPCSAARDAGSRGGITLLVTHRFSTVSAADLVVVLADGRVEEIGSPTELAARGGRYAELYALQARGYR